MKPKKHFTGSRQNDIFVKIAYYRLITFIARRDYETVARLIAEMKPLIQECSNNRFIALFHTEAGVECARTKKYDEATQHYLTAIANATDLDVGGLVAANLNNLAVVCSSTGRFEQAHEYVDQAIAINIRLDQDGLLAHKYDTKALIYFAARDYESALVMIDKSIDLSSQGEDYSGLTDAMFDKAKILLRLGQTENGLRVFSELMEIARIRLSKTSVEQFLKEFTKLIYAKRGVAYREEVKLFQKDLVRNALIESDNVTAKAKEILSVSQAGMSEILNKQYPELCDEVGMERRSSALKIKPIVIERFEYEGIDHEHLITFEISKEKLPQMDLRDDVVVAVVRGTSRDIEIGKFFLVQCQIRNVLECGRMFRLDSLGLYFFENEGTPNPFSPKDVSVIGEMVGYCYKDEVVDGFAKFRPLV